MWKTGLPVRSAVLKPHAGWLVVWWVTTCESQLLYVRVRLFSFLLAEFSAHATLPSALHPKDLKPSKIHSPSLTVDLAFVGGVGSRVPCWPDSSWQIFRSATAAFAFVLYLLTERVDLVLSDAGVTGILAVAFAVAWKVFATDWNVLICRWKARI